MAEKLLRKSKFKIIHVSVGCSGRLKITACFKQLVDCSMSAVITCKTEIISFVILNSRSKTDLNDHEVLNRLHNRDNL